ncbi:hypothetical protein OK074_3186 [Actinobacteria bacterium OK074]|nr:hypothetical protein OK074_3186 [Actinobacteria bacterium OK074]
MTTEQSDTDVTDVADVTDEQPVGGTAAEAEPVPEVPPRRTLTPHLAAALRWTAAVAVFAVVGAGTAYGITRADRTDVPGLATESDGRWTFPELTRPPLPSGSPSPYASANKAGAHYADLRRLVVPAPAGAKADAALRGTDGWLPTKTFLAEYKPGNDIYSRGGVEQILTDYGLRHIAARGWTTGDGTHTRVYLLQFETAAVVDELSTGKLVSYVSPPQTLTGTDTLVRDETFPDRANVDNVQRTAYVEPKPYGTEHVRAAFLSAGDTLALVVQSRKGAVVGEVPFQQTVVLQSELLG